jgi:transcriptional regulator with XRE-family HTH domain
MSRSNFSRALGNRLRFHMREAETTTDALADALGVGIFTVQRHMRGDTLPTVEQLQRYAELLNTSANELLPRLDSNQQPAGSGIAA